MMLEIGVFIVIIVINLKEKNHFKGVAVISVFFICVSVLSFCLKTHPSMRVPFLRNITVSGPGNSSYFLLDKVKTGK